jgi:hypothetical protein
METSTMFLASKHEIPSADEEPLDLDVGAKVGNTALSRGERVSRDGAFSSRRGTGEGLLPAPSELILPCSI